MKICELENVDLKKFRWLVGIDPDFFDVNITPISFISNTELVYGDENNSNQARSFLVDSKVDRSDERYKYFINSDTLNKDDFEYRFISPEKNKSQEICKLDNVFPLDEVFETFDEAVSWSETYLDSIEKEEKKFIKKKIKALLDLGISEHDIDMEEGTIKKQDEIIDYIVYDILLSNNEFKTNFVENYS